MRTKHLCFLIRIRIKGDFLPFNMFVPSGVFFFKLLTVLGPGFFCGSFLVVIRVCLCCVVLSVPCGLVVAYWDWADLLAWLSCVLCFLVFLSPFAMVSRVRCGT